MALALYAMVLWVSDAAATAQTSAARTAAGEADALYAQREDVAKARQAAVVWRQQLTADPKAFDAAWKLSRASYWLGTHGPASERRADLDAGMDAATSAMRVDAARPEGHFWLAANMGALAESFGMSQGIKYRKPIRQALETVLTLDPAFQQGSADRALGRWYFKVPRLFGGSNEKSVEHLRKSLTYNPRSTATLFFLAETLADMGKKDAARQALQQVLVAPFDPEWAPEDREWKAKARSMLASLK